MRQTGVLRNTILWLFYLIAGLIPLSIELPIYQHSFHITYPTEILVALLGLLLPFYFIFRTNRKINLKTLDWLVVGFIAAIGITTVFSFYFKISLKYFAAVSAFCCCGYITPRLLQLRRKEWKNVLFFFCAGMVTLSLWTLVQFAIRGISYESSYNVSKPFIGQGHTNLSIVIEPLLLIALGMIALSRKKSYRLLGLILFIIAYAVIDYSWSRASFITTSLALVAYFVLEVPVFKKKLIVPYIVVSVLLCILISVVIFIIVKYKYLDPNWSHYAFLLTIAFGIFTYKVLVFEKHKKVVLYILIGISIPIGIRKSAEFVHEQFYRDYSYYDPNDPSTRKANSMFNVMDLSKEHENTSNLERKIRWKNGLKMFKADPVTGIGPGCFPEHQLKYLEEDMVVDKSSISHFKMNIHNLYLAWLSEGGLIWFLAGMSLMIYLWIKMIGSISRINKPNTSIQAVPKRQSKIKRLLLIYLATFTLHGIFQDFGNEPRVIITFWTAAALISMTTLAANSKNKLINTTGK